MDRLAGCRVPALTLLDGIALDHGADHQKRWEGVRELEDAESGDESAESAEVGDGGGDDKGERPVDWHQADPDELAGALVEVWEAEKLFQDVLVDHLDADVAVERCSNEGREEGDDVAGGVCCGGAHSLVGRIDRVLALVGVDEESKEYVAEEDEALSADHSLPEVPGLAHLRHEFAEKHGTSVRVNCLHETGDGRTEANGVRRGAGIRVHDTVAFGNRVQVGRHGVIGGRISNHAHCHDKHDNVEPNCQVCNPTKSLESTNLTENHAAREPNDAG